MHGVMSSSVRGLLCAAVVVAAGALAGCTVYVQRAESAYHSGRYLEVAEVLAERETEIDGLTRAQRTRYGLYRGLALIQLGESKAAERWLRFAQMQQTAAPTLTPMQLKELQKGFESVARSSKEAGAR